MPRGWGTASLRSGRLQTGARGPSYRLGKTLLHFSEQGLQRRCLEEATVCLVENGEGGDRSRLKNVNLAKGSCPLGPQSPHVNAGSRSKCSV